ncbi:MAG TPA: FtsX-like permease family protein, partial [Alphaproteobacteria bacterium]|nr:FtsX-like permease family protein [Alphaproteobacteria bacterium]
VTIDSVSSDYLETMGIPLLRGRGFDSSVREDSPHVVIINETAARRFWPNENAVDKRFKFFGDTEWTQVIGVARDSKYNTLGEDPLPYVYQPVIQAPSPAVTLFVRSNTDPAAILSTVRERVQALDRNLPLTNVFPFGEVISQALWNARFGATLIGIFASLALLLCSVGIYGVVGYSVGQRVREIGVRMALGAQRGDVLRMVLRQSAITIGVGLALGLVFSFVLARLAAQQLGGVLYGISASTPYAFVGMALVLALVGLLASYIPARRAASVDPLAALRNE